MLKKLTGILLRPQEAFQLVCQKPNWLRVLAVNLLINAVTTSLFLKSAVGMELVRNNQLDNYNRIRDQITASAYDQLVSNHERALPSLWLTQPWGDAISNILSMFALGGLLFAICTAVFGPGRATSRSILAVMSYSLVILTIGRVFSTCLMYVTRSVAAGTTLGVFLPTVDEASSIYLVASHIDLMGVWWAAVLGIGVAVLYGCRVGRTMVTFVVLHVIQSVGHSLVEVMIGPGSVAAVVHS